MKDQQPAQQSKREQLRKRAKVSPRERRPNSDPFATEQLVTQLYKQYQMKQSLFHVQGKRSLSRVRLLLGLVLVLATLVTLANLLVPQGNEYATTTITNSETPTGHNRYSNTPRKVDKRRQRPRKQHTPFDGDPLLHREITVVEYQDMVQEQQQHKEGASWNDHREQQVDTTAAAAPNANVNAADDTQWSPEQINEMEKYYKRYLQVFYETHGHEYEPEPKEVVYTEYLKFREQKRKEREERRQKQATAGPERKETGSEPSNKARVTSALHEEETNNHRKKNKTVSHRVVADQIMVKPAPPLPQKIESVVMGVAKEVAASRELVHVLSSTATRNNFTETMASV